MQCVDLNLKLPSFTLVLLATILANACVPVAVSLILTTVCDLSQEPPARVLLQHGKMTKVWSGVIRASSATVSSMATRSALSTMQKEMKSSAAALTRTIYNVQG